jgi:arylsulfatase A-like enzyme
MTDRILIIIAVAVLGAINGTAAPAPARPNILHINADDHRADGLRALGNPVLQTPHLDALAGRGLAFTRAYTMGAMTPAVCLPSRVMMHTGRSLFRVSGHKEVPGTTPLAALLKSAGYETWHLGKRGNEYRPAMQVFDTYQIDDGQGEGEAGNRAFSSRRYADRTIAFLQKRDAAKSFYIYLGPPVPHDPREAEPQFHALYDPAKLPLPPAFLPQHPWDNGDMTVRDEKLAPWPRTPEDTRRQLADYYACITGLDHHIGRIIDALRQIGQLENTIIVFTGDNGLSMGEHGLFGKQNLYEFGGMHVPFVIAGPGIPRGRRDALVYLMDLYPTLCHLAGVTPPAGTEGRDLRPLFASPAAKVRDVLFTAYLDVQRAVRDDRWKLIRYPQVDRTQLFDLAADPRELINLAERPEHSAALARMRALLERESERLGDVVTWTSAQPKPAAWSPPP